MAKRRAPSREGFVVTTVALPKELHKRLLLAALGENAAATELVREAVADYLKKHDQRKGRRPL
jgi:hypothetical protein